MKKKENSVKNAALPVEASAVRKEERSKKTGINPDEYVLVKGGVDGFMLFIILTLLVFGLIMVFSASYADAESRYGDSYYFIKRQGVMVAIGLVFMAVAARIPIKMYKMLAVPAYIAAVGLLLMVFIPGIGDSGGGANRWIVLGPLRFQPSEIAKYALILALSWYYSKFESKAFDFKNKKNSRVYGTLIPIGIMGFVCGLVILEKHLSGTIIMGAIGLMIMFASGINCGLLGGLMGVGVAGITAFALLTDYTKRRIDIWKNPSAYPQDGGWQTLQGMMAIGSGGFFGLGLGNSRQKFSYVSMPQNDFIFVIICEELGFVGAMAVMILFGLLVWRGCVIASRVPDRFSQLVAIGISCKVALQVLLNIAVVTNSIPNTGVSLPFFSYGGSAMVVQLVEMGTVLAISRYTVEKK